MAFVKRFLTEPELAALDLPALGVPSYYLELGDPAFADEDRERTSNILRRDWAVDEARHAFLKELFLASDHRDGLYVHLLIVEGKLLFFELYTWKGKQVGERFLYEVRVQNPAVLAEFPPGYLEGLANEGMALLDAKGGGVTFQPAA